jgi:ribosomal protein L23
VVFQVAAGANKIDVRRAVEKLLGSKVASVRTALAHGKFKRQGKFMGRRPDWKKAYVTLREGEKLLGAKVDTIRTTIAHGKVKRQGRYAGQRPDWKKAYVRLREGQKMPEFLEGA